jgi:PglZ domain
MPNSWRDHILQSFAPQVARLTLVADPDSLLIEEGILQELQARGYELLTWNDPVAFRFIYETKYRTRWDQNESTEQGLILRIEAEDLHALPEDLLQAGRHLTFTLGHLFPNLSAPVVAALGRSEFDALFRAQQQHHPGKLGDNATKDFILRYVFDVTPELSKEPSDLLRVLLRRHYRAQHVPAILDERFIQLLQRDVRFQEWPLERIVPDREAFFGFLQERWPHFVRRWLRQRSQSHGEETALELAADPALGYMGSTDLPFDYDDIRVYIDNLFLEGYLKPYAAADHGLHLERTDLPEWLRVGLRIDPEADRLRRVEGLLTSIAASVPSAEARHHDWLAFAHRWGELLAVWHQLSPAVQPPLTQRFQEIREHVDFTFLTWVQQRSGGLHNLPAAQPAMLHHIPRYLARELDTPGVEKVALVVLDGLACDQWVVLREVLIQQRPQLHYQEAAVFAWIPTITSVSRQAAFAGKPPVYYPGSIHRTDKEAALWSQFWSDHGLSQTEVAYARGLSQGSDLSNVEAALTHPKVRVIGLVVDAVDKIMHGMTLGTAGMHNQVRQWAAEGFLARLLDLLFDHSYAVFLTSDHGNIECMGRGRPSEGAVADLRGERVRVYPDPALRAQVQARFPDALDWPALGLPENYFPLLAPGRSAFVQEGVRIVGHGSITLEELIVPFIRIERRGP